MVPRVPEHLPDQPSGLADVLVDDRRRDDFEKIRVHVGGDRAREQGLARARGAIKQDTFGGLDAAALEELRVEQGELDGLADLADLFVLKGREKEEERKRWRRG